MKRPRISLACSCGDSAKGIASPLAAATKLRAIWLSVHTGDGHEVTDTSDPSIPQVITPAVVLVCVGLSLLIGWAELMRQAGEGWRP